MKGGPFPTEGHYLNLRKRLQITSERWRGSFKETSSNWQDGREFHIAKKEKLSHSFLSILGKGKLEEVFWMTAR